MIKIPVHFLVVEDDDDHAELIAMEFERIQIPGTIDRVPDGEAALAYLRREGEYAGRRMPDVILLDLKLPKISGHEVLRRIKDDDRLCMIPVVILTTSNAESDRTQAYRNHANSYLVKPADVTSFQKMVEDLKAYWAAWNERPEPASPA